jgi:hypothetical protein
MTLVALFAGAALAGAGTYGQWLRGEVLGPHKLAPYLFAAGAALFLVVSLAGRWAARPVRVGDAGVAVEKEGSDIDRLGWSDVTGIVLSDEMVTFQGSGRAISIPRLDHPDAAARALYEATVRIPARAKDLSASTEPPYAGDVLPLDPALVAGRRCKRSGKAIAFEKDARFCGRCGELYHKDSVPERCLTCDAAL